MLGIRPISHVPKTKILEKKSIKKNYDDFNHFLNLYPLN